MAAHMFNSGKNGVSAHEIHRSLGVTYKTAWFMMHRLREAMNELSPTPMGGEGQAIQADETYYGNTSKRAKGYKKGLRHKQSIVALIEPKGRARVFHVKRLPQHPSAKSSSPMFTARLSCIRTKAISIPKSGRNLPRTRLSSTAPRARPASMSAKTARARTPSRISSAISSVQ